MRADRERPRVPDSDRTPAARGTGARLPAGLDRDAAPPLRHPARGIRLRAAIFADSDLDEHDDDPGTLHALGFCDGVPAGAVRLFPLRGELWQGDRLAVLRPYRTVGLGSPLVRLAVGEATARGGKRMVAHIQTANVAFFRRLGWELDGPAEIYHGAPHQPMAVALG